ncbi:hypothetical protein PVL29_023280 [Vitis rotundifolia]|uniref:Sister chromatid cohesion protein PDS5 homolog A n=1 Tax=Vitis rotundifolia TaxID=103349 RepID=A0AA38YNI8_VITRO|nr:hypothetical protein PVL29_023280 [Vitis rotundifolia]
MADDAAKLVAEIGGRLHQQSRPTKDFLIKSLRQAASALSELEQKSSLEPAIKPLSGSFVKHGLLHNKDKDVKLLVAICCSEIIRVMAPEPPFDDKELREIFELFVSMFAELANTTSPYFSRRVKILETFAKYNFCMLMLDINCDILVLEMFNTFFSVAREHHQQSVVKAILSIMTLILKEKVSQPLLDVILQNLLKEGKGATASPSRIAVSVVQNCAEELEPFVCGFLTSCILDRDAVGNELKEFYHEIIFEIFQCAPQMLLAVIPNLTQELLTDQVDVRIKAVNLIGKLFSLPEHHVVQEYRHLFVEFLKRFSDKSAEVRVSALQCAKACYMANSSGTESLEILTAVEGRLLDFDDRVRMQAVIVVCDLAKSNLKFLRPELISRATDRLRDKKLSVRKKALQKLLEVYREYCSKCSEGHIAITDHFEQIPCRILMLCYDKDCKEFRPQNMELVLAEDLFPATLSVEERTRHWISFFSLFTPLHVKALNSILSQKRRLQTEMQIYLALRKKVKENVDEEVQKRIQASFVKMSASFPDACKAEECFHKLNQMKDNSIFKALVQLLDEVTLTSAETTRDKFLKMIGERHPHFEFLQSLSKKCLFNIFSSEHVRYILEHISSNRVGNKHLEVSSFDLLLVIISIFPSLLKGSEKLFQMLLFKEDIPFQEKLIQVLGKAGPHISIKLSDIYLSLERICLEGSRAQSKFAVSAIAALVGTSEQFVFSELCKALVDSLHAGQNIPTILQSLGCMAQHSVSAFEARDKEITSYINETFFQVEPLDNLASFDETSECSSSCKLKIYALKALVKSFLPHRGTHVKRQINDLLDIMSEMLQKGDISYDTGSCENDKAHIRLAAAKSVLRLAGRWDLHISPHIFRSTILVAKDPSPLIRRLFLDKTHKLLKEHAIPSRYACAFAFAGPDCPKDLQEDSLKYMAEFMKECRKEAQVRQTSAMQGGTITDYPAYMVVFLVHVLAHDTNFPSETCQDEEIFAQFCSPLFFTLQVLVNASFIDGGMDLDNDAISCIFSIFRAIKRAEDAVDAQRTLNLHILADIGIFILKALNTWGISMSNTPDKILLPSSLYRISSAKKSEEVNSTRLTGSTFDENFLKRLIPIFKSNLSVSSTAHPKRGRKCQDSSHLDIIKSNTLNLAPSREVASSKNGTIIGQSSSLHGKTQKIVMQEISTGGRRKHPVSPTVHKSVGLHNKCCINNGHKSDKGGKSEPSLGQGQLSSSCGSATMRPLTESQISTKKMVLPRAASLKANGTAKESSSVTTKPSKSSRSKRKDPCSSVEIINNSEVLIGQRIKLWSPVDKCFYSVTVDGFNSQNNTHKVAYDNGAIEALCLASENWETISDGSLSKTVKLAQESNGFHMQKRDPLEISSLSSLKETVDAVGDDASQQQEKFHNKGRTNSLYITNPGSVKGKHGQKVSVDTLASEVVNMNEIAVDRRTRRRKT